VTWRHLLCRALREAVARRRWRTGGVAGPVTTWASSLGQPESQWLVLFG
jgi:hypothetical protein